MRIALAQFDFTVGAVAANTARVIALAREARDRLDASLIVFPELALCGYPPEDLLLRPSFLDACEAAVDEIAAACPGIAVLVGHPQRLDHRLLNVASWIADGEVRARCIKRALPNYSVFDEKRYFGAGDAPCVVEHEGHRIGVLICEDLWVDGPARDCVSAGAELLVSLNASPFDLDKRLERRVLLRRRAQECAVPVVYLNLVGGQDDVVFDGSAVLADAQGQLVGEAPAFEESLLALEITASSGELHLAQSWPTADDSRLALIYRGLVRATADYVRKNGFPGVLLGLSGGIDSALTLAIAVDALGADRVHAVMMPSRYTSELSLEGAAHQARSQGVDYRVLPIEASNQALLDTLTPSFEGRSPDVTEENLQARIRGVLLMALSNKFGHLLLTTGNKSEVAVGYATLYGDMCGGFAPIKDVYKTEVYALCRWRNALSPVIPDAVIERPPSAELRADQTDQDSLPPYEVLDAILYRFIELERSQAEIVADGFDAETVRRVVMLVLRNEYKRRQSAPGPKISNRAFGRERRYPVTNAWR